MSVLDCHLRMVRRHAGRRFELDLPIASDAACTALLGPSGAGKSLALRAIAGLEPMDAGHVRVAGATWFDAAARTDLPARRRGTGYVFQHYALFPHLSVADNVGFGLRGHPAAAQRVATLLAQFALTAEADALPRTLSGGQQQRVALARALAPAPRLLLLDEPLSALDAPLRARLRRELAALLADTGTPALLVTHDPADVDALAQAVLPVRDGRLATG